MGLKNLIFFYFFQKFGVEDHLNTITKIIAITIAAVVITIITGHISPMAE